MNFKCIKPAYTQKNQQIDREKSPNLHILKKIKKNKKTRLYVGLTGIDELVLDFFDFFEYMQVLSFGLKILIVLNICRFGDFSLSFFLIF